VFPIFTSNDYSLAGIPAEHGGCIPGFGCGDVSSLASRLVNVSLGTINHALSNVNNPAGTPAEHGGCNLASFPGYLYAGTSQ
jgi:hypothetical protein